jgi:hypothetical protein
VPDSLAERASVNGANHLTEHLRCLALQTGDGVVGVARAVRGGRMASGCACLERLLAYARTTASAARPWRRADAALPSGLALACRSLRMCGACGYVCCASMVGPIKVVGVGVVRVSRAPIAATLAAAERSLGGLYAMR